MQELFAAGQFRIKKYIDVLKCVYCCALALFSRIMIGQINSELNLRFGYDLNLALNFNYWIFNIFYFYLIVIYFSLCKYITYLSLNCYKGIVYSFF